MADPPSKPREFFIHGTTAAGRPFRPSDWAERLCGVMSGYRPGGAAMGRDAQIGYSPYVRPMLVGGGKCVVGDERDLVRLRTNFRGEQVHLYRLRTDPGVRAAGFSGLPPGNQPAPRPPGVVQRAYEQLYHQHPGSHVSLR